MLDNLLEYLANWLGLFLDLFHVLVYIAIILVGGTFVLNFFKRFRKDHPPASMDTSRGTAWFTFYTKVKPAISVGIAFYLLAKSSDAYFDNWDTMLILLCGEAGAVLSVIVWAKSSEDYGALVRFVNYVLAFECISTAYTLSVIDGMLSEPFFLLFLLLFIFVWFLPNKIYFENRIKTE